MKKSNPPPSHRQAPPSGIVEAKGHASAFGKANAPGYGIAAGKTRHGPRSWKKFENVQSEITVIYPKGLPPRVNEKQLLHEVNIRIGPVSRGTVRRALLALKANAATVATPSTKGRRQPGSKSTRAKPSDSLDRLLRAIATTAEACSEFNLAKDALRRSTDEQMDLAIRQIEDAESELRNAKNKIKIHADREQPPSGLRPRSLSRETIKQIADRAEARSRFRRG